MSSRSLEDLDPRFRPFVDRFEIACPAQGLDTLIYCTRRSSAEQDELWTHGRTAPGKVVTNARGGESAHNYGLAFDGCPLLHGKPLWDEPLSHAHWQLYGKIAVECGMEWGGNWAGHMVEGPHCQMAKWRDLTGDAHGG